VADGRSEKGLADPDGPEKQHVLLALDEAEPEEVADPIAVEGDGRVPIETLERLLVIEGRPSQTQRQVELVAAVNLVLEAELQKLLRREARLLGVRRSIRQRR
jgi:hypothetical protein